jgi:hypothetical protein
MSRLLLPTALALLAGPAHGPDRVAFVPAEGLELGKRFEVSTRLELDDFTFTVDGEDVGAAMRPELELGAELAVAVTDTYVRVADGRPTELRRRYDEIGIEARFDYESEVESGAESAVGESDLEGETVVFRWDADENAYAAELADDEGDDELCVGLFEDMDLRALLPPAGAEVDEGSLWALGPATLAPVLAPGGALGLAVREPSREATRVLDALSGLDLGELVDSLRDGEVVATYTGTRDVDGRAVAGIDLRFDVDASADVREALLELVDELGADMPDDFDLSRAELALGAEGTARLEWDVAGGHLRHFEAKADATASLRVVATSSGKVCDVAIGLSGELELRADALER